MKVNYPAPMLHKTEINERRRRYNKGGRLTKSNLLQNVICEGCGKVFSQKVSNQRFCSKKCREINQKKPYICLYERDNFRCIYCGKSSIEDNVKLHIDHIIPKSLTHDFRANNLVTACEDCNVKKSNHLFSDDIINRILLIVEKRNIEFNIDPNQLFSVAGNDFNLKQFA